MEHSSSFSRHRSDGRRLAERRAGIAFLWMLLGSILGPGKALATGEVRGSISVERAVVRSTGDKDDLDVVVLLEPVSGEPAPAIEGRAAMDQKGLVFLPHVLAVQKGTTVTFLNNDNEPHNVYFLDDRTGDTLDIGTWGAGVSVDHVFIDAGMVITLCKLHLEMAAYVLVSDGPHFVAVRLDPETSIASYRIAGVPAGDYELRIWHKKLKQKGGAQPVRIDDGAAAEAPVVITKAKYARQSK